MARSIDANKKTSSRKKKPASPEQLVKGGKAGEVELNEDELKDVTGGAFDAYLKIKGGI